MTRTSPPGEKDRWTPKALKIIERARKSGIPTFATPRSDYERDVLRLTRLELLHVRQETQEVRKRLVVVELYRATSNGELAIRQGTVDPHRIVSGGAIHYQSNHRQSRQQARKRVKTMQRAESFTRTLIGKTVSTVGLSVVHATDWLEADEFEATPIGKIAKRIATLCDEPTFVLGEVVDAGMVGFSTVETIQSPTKCFKRFLYDRPIPGRIDDACSVVSLSRFDGGALLVILEATKEEQLSIVDSWRIPRSTSYVRGLFLTSSETIASYLMMELR